MDSFEENIPEQLKEEDSWTPPPKLTREWSENYTSEEDKDFQNELNRSLVPFNQQRSLVGPISDSWVLSQSPESENRMDLMNLPNMYVDPGKIISLIK